MFSTCGRHVEFNMLATCWGQHVASMITRRFPHVVDVLTSTCRRHVEVNMLATCWIQHVGDMLRSTCCQYDNATFSTCCRHVEFNMWATCWGQHVGDMFNFTCWAQHVAGLITPRFPHVGDMLNATYRCQHIYFHLLQTTWFNLLAACGIRLVDFSMLPKYWVTCCKQVVIFLFRRHGVTSIFNFVNYFKGSKFSFRCSLNHYWFSNLLAACGIRLADFSMLQTAKSITDSQTLQSSWFIMYFFRNIT